jgi:hypothetical protein
MSKINELAWKEYEKNGIDSLSNPVLTLMSEIELDKIVLNEYEKTGKLPEFNGNKTGKIVRPWFNYTFGGNRIFQFNNGVKITTILTRSMRTYTNTDDSTWNIPFLQICTIELTNGVKITAPKNTKVSEDNKGKFIITVGDENATVIQSDGTSTTVKKGTKLDKEGNIID